MSYQYPPPLQPSPQIAGNFHLPPAISPERTQPPSEGKLLSQGANQQAHSKSGKIKRSSSTPNIRGQAATDAALAASAERRRNKLGYHRTSVACGHCRRRKIRCILAPGDLQNRCANCIRLKKECNFYPVDQAPPPELKGQSGAAGGREHGRTSSSASPTNQSSHSSEMQNGLPYSTLSMPPYIDVKRPRTDNSAPENKVPIFGVPNEYPPPSASWMHLEPSSATRPAPDTSVYYTQESPLTPAFSAFSPNLHLPHQHNWMPAAAADASPREDMNWSAPQRSLSFGNLENLPHQSAYPHFPQSSAQTDNREHFVPRPFGQHSKSYMRDHPPANLNSVSATPSGPAIEHNSRVSGPSQVPPFPVAQDWQSHAQYNYAKTLALPGGDGFTSWYGSSSNMPPTPHVGGEGMQSAPYSHGEDYGAVYYNDDLQPGRQ